MEKPVFTESAARARLGVAVEGGVIAAYVWLGAGALGIDQVLGRKALDHLALAALVGFGIALVGGRRVLRLAGAGVFLLLLLVGLTPWVGALARARIRSDSLPPDGIDAVVVLSAGLSADGGLNQEGVDRLLSGLALVRAGVSRHLVVSRITRRYGSATVSLDADQRWLIAVSGLDVAVHVVSPVGTTRMEAQRTAELAARERWRRIVLVTSPLHTRRACAAFQRLRLQVVCRPSEQRYYALRTLARPTDRVRAFGDWLYETLGWWKYRLMGWV